MVPSGYGRQTALALRQLTDLGHDVAVSSYHGVTGSIVDWHGFPVYPGGMAPFGVDTILPHADHFGAKLLLTLMDTWSLMPILDHLAESLKLDGAPHFACWTPVDCEPMSQGDRHVLRKTGALPIAMSRHGVAMMERAGLRPAYVPHSVDTSIYKPVPDARQKIRDECGTGQDTFVVGIVAANRDLTRKSWAEQFEGFSLHLRAYPDSQLWVHTIANGMRGAGGFDLRTMAAQMGIGHAIRFTDEYPQVCGLIDDHDMAFWYNAIDLLSSCSYGEGFGLPIIEAQACGTPALATGGSAMTEHATWVVGGSRWWNAVHDAWWVRPNPVGIAAAYDRYRSDRSQGLYEPPHIIAERVARFDVDRVTTTHWKPLLDAFGAGGEHTPVPFERHDEAAGE